MKDHKSKDRIDNPTSDYLVEKVEGHVDRFEEQIETIHDWIDLLSSTIPRADAEGSMQSAEAFQSLTVAVEELSVVGEELRQQNEQLILAREFLEESRRKYEDLFEFAPDGYIVTDLYGKIEDVNRAACEQFNLPKHFLLGKPLMPLVARSHRRTFIDWLVSIRTGERDNLHFETRIQPRKAPAFDAVITVGLIRTPDHEPVGLRWLTRDIQDLRRVEAKLYESDTRFQTVFGEAEVGIAILALNGDIQVTNPALQRMLEQPEQKLSGRSIFSFIHADDLESWKAAFNFLAKGNGDRKHLQASLVGIHGTEVSTRLALSLVRTVLNKPNYIILIVENITDERRMEQELIDVEGRLTDAAEKERVRLAQELHDGPLQDLYGIMYQLKMISLGKVDGPTYNELDRARDMLQQTIDQLRNTTGGLRPPTLAHFGLEQAIRSYANTIAEMTPGLDIHLDLQSDNTFTERVRTAMFRIFQQGLMNVVRHANAHRANIRLQLDEDKICLEIKDDGVGFQLPHRWKELIADGHYGLVGAAERAVSIGGKLEIQSHPGRGTTMRLVVPRRVEDQVQKERLSVEISNAAPSELEENRENQ